MPLKRGSSRQISSENIRTLMHTCKREGQIVRSLPPTAPKAVQQAAAIAYALARRSRRSKEVT